MTKKGMAYEAPKAKVYRFDENDKILTDSSGIAGPPTSEPTAEYAANALNRLMNGTNTTIERQSN